MWKRSTLISPWGVHSTSSRMEKNTEHSISSAQDLNATASSIASTINRTWREIPRWDAKVVNREASWSVAKSFSLHPSFTSALRIPALFTYDYFPRIHPRRSSNFSCVSLVDFPFFINVVECCSGRFSLKSWDNLARTFQLGLQRVNISQKVWYQFFDPDELRCFLCTEWILRDWSVTKLQNGDWTQIKIASRKYLWEQCFVGCIQRLLRHQSFSYILRDFDDYPTFDFSPRILV